MSKPVVLPLLVCALVGCGRPSFGPPPPSLPVVAPTVAAVPAKPLVLPDIVTGWTRTPSRPLPGESNAYTLGYNGPDMTAVTVFVYTRNLKFISPNLTSPEVQKELTSAKSAIQQAKLQGIYQDVKEEEDGEATLGSTGPNALYARFRLRLENQDLLSELYVLSRSNQFIKVRTSRPAMKSDTTEAALRTLYAALAKALAP